MAKNHYKTLGVSRDASPAEVLKAYRELARKYHPDLNPDDTSAKERFQEVQAAFDVLGDSSKREMYDRYGSAFESTGPGGPQGHSYTWSSDGGPGSENVDFADLFGERYRSDATGGFADIFKQFRRASGRGTQTTRPPSKGSDLEHALEVPFATAVSGGEATISLRRANGKEETIRVKIPAGIEDGKKIRLRGQGESSPNGGPPGDVLITIRSGTHPHFRRHGSNLEVRIPVTLAEAARGAKVDVPTPKGTIALSIPPGTSSGTKLRVKGHGVASQGKHPGDLLAEIMVVLPEKLDEQDRTLLETISKKDPRNPRSDLRW